MPFRIRQAQHDDVQALRPLRHALWPGCPEPKHDIEIAQLLSSGGQLFLAEDADRNVVGFAEVSLRRDHVEGASISPVPYLEGWFVAPSSRRKGIGRALLGAVEDWAVSRGFSELASDAGISNERSIRLHRQLGFAEVEHTVSFLKRLRPAPAQESSVGPSNPQYVLRPATNDDRPAIERLIFGVLVEHGLEPDPASTDADLGDIESAYHARGGFFDVLVARRTRGDRYCRIVSRGQLHL